MPTCPAGHPSGDAEYCEVCGIRMSVTTTTSSGSPTLGGLSPAGSGAGVTECPDCGEPIFDRFCEVCGLDTLNPQSSRSRRSAGQPAPAPPMWTSGGAHSNSWANNPTWIAIVGADRDYYERLMATSGADPGELSFPHYLPARQYPLMGQYVRVGRRSMGRGVKPEIDLSLPPEDPAVSHEHAVLLSKPDGSWSVVDLGSSNGTAINDVDDPVAPHIEVPLVDGDRIFLGAWTVITVRKG